MTFCHCARLALRLGWGHFEWGPKGGNMRIWCITFSLLIRVTCFLQTKLQNMTSKFTNSFLGLELDLKNQVTLPPTPLVLSKDIRGRSLWKKYCLPGRIEMATVFFALRAFHSWCCTYSWKPLRFFTLFQTLYFWGKNRSWQIFTFRHIWIFMSKLGDILEYPKKCLIG